MSPVFRRRGCVAGHFDDGVIGVAWDSTGAGRRHPNPTPDEPQGFCTEVCVSHGTLQNGLVTYLYNLRDGLVEVCPDPAEDGRRSSVDNL